MSDSNDKIYIDHEFTREDYYTLIGTPEALREFAGTLSDELSKLPTPLPDTHWVPLEGLAVEAADGRKKEVYLGVRAEPSHDWLIERRNSGARRDWLIIIFLVTAAGFSLFGVWTALSWFLALLF